MGFEWGWADINWLAVVVAIAAKMIVGVIWYNKRVLGTIWMEDTGMTDEKIRSGNIPLVYGSMIVLLITTTIAMALVTGNIGDGL